MELSISEKSKSVRDLFIHGKLEECIDLASQFDPEDEDFNSYQYSQIYKALSQEELSLEIEGSESFKNLIELSKSKKGNRVEEIDVIMYVLYQWENFDHDNDLAIETNPTLLDCCREYYLQSNEKGDYNEYLYKFGMSMYYFISDIEQSQDDTATKELIKCVDKINYLKEEILFLIGWQFDYLSDQEQALKWYEIMEKENPYFPGALNNIAVAYQNQNDMDNAEKYYLKSLEVCPKNAITLSNLAFIYQRMKKTEKVIYYYEKAIETNPTQIQGYMSYAKYLYNCESMDTLKQVLTSGLDHPKINIPILNLLIKYAFLSDNLDEALEYLGKQISTDPDNGIFEFDYALLLRDHNLLDESLEFLQKCLLKKLPPSKIVSAHSNIGYVYNLQGKELEALNQCIYTCGLDIEDSYENELTCIADQFNLDTLLSTQQKINIVESFSGLILTRLDKIICLIENPQIKSLFERRLDLYVNTLNFVAYKKYIQSLLTFQSEYVHWDLFLD